MLERLLTAGDKVEVMRTSGLANNQSDKKVYYSMLVDIDAEDRLTVTMPIEAGKVVPLAVGDRYWLVFYTHSGIYQAKASIVTRERQGNVHVMILRTLTELERIQRRQFYRIECVMDVEYRIMDEAEAKGYEILRTKAYKTMEDRVKIKRLLVPSGNNWNKGVVVDISGGGMRFNTKETHENPSYLELRFLLNIGPVVKEILTPARVIHYTAVRNIQGTKEFRVEFVEIPTKQREDIVQFVFNEDRNRRKLVQERK